MHSLHCFWDAIKLYYPYVRASLIVYACLCVSMCVYCMCVLFLTVHTNYFQLNCRLFLVKTYWLLITSAPPLDNIMAWQACYFHGDFPHGWTSKQTGNMTVNRVVQHLWSGKQLKMESTIFRYIKVVYLSLSNHKC